MALEVYPFGIQVCLIQPGDCCTGFTDHRNVSSATLNNSDYGESFARTLAVIEKEERNGAPPCTIAKAVCQLVEHRRPPFRTKAGSWIQVMFAHAKRWLPDRLTFRILRAFYAVKRNR